MNERASERESEIGEKEREREGGSSVRKQLSRESRHLAARRLPGVSYIDLVWLISRPTSRRDR